MWQTVQCTPINRYQYHVMCTVYLTRPEVEEVLLILLRYLEFHVVKEMSVRAMLLSQRGFHSSRTSKIYCLVKVM